MKALAVLLRLLPRGGNGATGFRSAGHFARRSPPLSPEGSARGEGAEMETGLYSCSDNFRVSVQWGERASSAAALTQETQL